MFIFFRTLGIFSWHMEGMRNHFNMQNCVYTRSTHGDINYLNFICFLCACKRIHYARTTNGVQKAISGR